MSNSNYDNLILSRSGLLAYWEMADAAGSLSAVDSSGNGYTLTANNGPTFGATGLLASDPDSSVSLDGVNDYFDVPALSVLTKWSVETWARPSDVSGEHTVYSQDQSGFGNDVLFGINPENPGGITAARLWGIVHQDLTTASRTVAQGGSLAVAGTTYYVVATSDGATLRLYVDGVLVASTARSGSALTLASRAGNIGRNPNTLNRIFSGPLAKFAICNRALTDAEILQTYRMGRGLLRPLRNRYLARTPAGLLGRS